MIDNRHISAVVKLQKIMQGYEEKIAAFLEGYQRLNAQVAKSLKPFFDNMEFIQRSMANFKKFNLLPPKKVIENLQEIQQRIEAVHYSRVRSINIAPELLLPNLSDDVRFKRLIKEAIKEYGLEEQEKKQKEIDELSKNRKIEGFNPTEEKKQKE